MTNPTKEELQNLDLKEVQKEIARKNKIINFFMSEIMKVNKNLHPAKTKEILIRILEEE